MLLASTAVVEPQEPRGYSYSNLPPLHPADPRQAVENWLRRSLWSSRSYQPLDWSRPVYMPYGWHFNWAIRHLYIYEHPEHGFMENDEIFYFDADGQVAGRTNTSLWRNQAKPVPEWGWGWEKWGPEGKQPLREEWDRRRDNVGW